MKGKTFLALVIGLGLSLAAFPSLAEEKIELAAIQKQSDAYNSRNVNAILECYAEDVIIEDGLGNTIVNGIEELRMFYQKLFSNSPGLKYRILSHRKVGEWIVNEEFMTGVNMDGFPDRIHGAAVYRIVNGKIAYVRLTM